MARTLHLVSNADERFFPGLLVALASAVAAASGKFDYHLRVIDGGLSPESWATLRQTLGRIAELRGISLILEPLIIDESRLLALPERRGSRMTYAKLVLPEILADLDSILYLDADVLCFAGVETACPPAGEGEWLLAGARDFFSVIRKDCPWLDQVPPNERDLPYINCGVMWMNLAGLREMDFTGRAIEARAAIGEARQGDQSVFNFLCRGRSFLLPPAINHRTAIGCNRPLCGGELGLNLHYIGSPKPWLGAPKTSNWLAHRLWHQARAALVTGPPGEFPPPADTRTIRRKALLYRLTNPRRAADYRSDLQSLTDPGKILDRAAAHWKSTLGR